MVLLCRISAFLEQMHSITEVVISFPRDYGQWCHHTFLNNSSHLGQDWPWFHNPIEAEDGFFFLRSKLICLRVAPLCQIRDSASISCPKVVTQRRGTVSLFLCIHEFTLHKAGFSKKNGINIDYQDALLVVWMQNLTQIHLIMNYKEKEKLTKVNSYYGFVSEWDKEQEIVNIILCQNIAFRFALHLAQIKTSPGRAVPFLPHSEVTQVHCQVNFSLPRWHHSFCGVLYYTWTDVEAVPQATLL